MTVKILKRIGNPNGSINEKSKHTLKTHTNLDDRCDTYQRLRNDILGMNYNNNDDIKKLKVIAEYKLEDSYDQDEILHISKNSRDKLAAAYTYMHKNLKFMKTSQYKQEDLISDYVLIKDLENHFSALIKSNMSQKRRNNSDDEDTDEQLNTQSNYKRKKGNKSDLEKKKEEIHQLELLLSKTIDEEEKKHIEQKILSGTKIIDALSICSQFKEQKKLEKNKTQPNTRINTRSLTQNNTGEPSTTNTKIEEISDKEIRLNGKQNNQKDYLNKMNQRKSQQRYLPSDNQQQQSQQQQSQQQQSQQQQKQQQQNHQQSTQRMKYQVNSSKSSNGACSSNSLATNSSNTSIESDNYPSFGSKQILNRINASRDSPKTSTPENKQQSKKDNIAINLVDQLRAAYNAYTLKFVGENLKNYIQNKNSTDLQRKMLEITGDILVNYQCYKYEYVEEEEDKIEYVLKVYMHDEEDYLKMESKSFESIIGVNGERLKNELPLLIHTSISTKYDINEEEFMDHMHKEYGVIDMQRLINSKKTESELRNQNFTTVKMEIDNLNNWKKVLTNGMMIEGTKVTIVSEWEFEPQFCRKCLNYKHKEDKCIDAVNYCEICTKELSHINQKHICVMKCKHCNRNTHKTNDKCCSKYIMEKNQRNKHYKKLIEILEIVKSKYNIRRKHNIKSNNNETTNEKQNLEAFKQSVKNEVSAELDKLKEHYTREKDEILQIINRLKDNQKRTNKKMKEKMATSTKDTEIVNLRIKAIADEMIKDTAVKKKLEDEINAIESREIVVSDDDSIDGMDAADSTNTGTNA